MINRREFIIAAAGGLLSVVAGGDGGRTVMAKQLNVNPKGTKTKVSLVKTSDRASGINKAIELLGINPVKEKDVLLKPNFNTADPFPGSTHNDTLIHLILHLKKLGAKSITIGERSGPPDTSSVLKEKGIYDLSKKLGVGLINFEELTPDGWIRIRPEKSHWINGFDVAKPVLDSKCIVLSHFDWVISPSLMGGVGDGEHLILLQEPQLLIKRDSILGQNAMPARQNAR